MPGDLQSLLSWLVTRLGAGGTNLEGLRSMGEAFFPSSIALVEAGPAVGLPSPAPASPAFTGCTSVCAAYRRRQLG